MGRPRSEVFPGFGGRLRQALIEQGYAYDDGRPDYYRFAHDHRWNAHTVWRWLTEKIAISYSNGLQIAGQLGVSLAWLLFGDPIAKFPTPEKNGAKANGHVKPRTSAGGALAPLPVRRQHALTATGSVPARRVSRKVASKQAKRPFRSIMTTRNPWWLGGSTPLRRAA